MLSTGGFDSTTAKHALAQDVAELLEEWPAVEVLHVGDYDPSGVHVFSSLAQDVQAFVSEFGPDGAVLFTRLAVTPEQIAAMDLPTAPKKKTDLRLFEGDATTQAEAIPPEALATIVHEAIETRQDAEMRAGVMRSEKHAKAELLLQLARLDDDHA